MNYLPKNDRIESKLPSNSDQAITNQRAAVAVIHVEDKFLTITRSQTVRAPGKVCFPGGGVEPNESITDALIREMQEELSITVQPQHFVWQSHSLRGFELNWWRAEILEGELIQPNPDEVAAHHWMTADEILRLPNLLDSNLEFFQAWQRKEFEL